MNLVNQAGGQALRGRGLDEFKATRGRIGQMMGELGNCHAGSNPRPAFRRGSGQIEDLRPKLTGAVTKRSGRHSTAKVTLNLSGLWRLSLSCLHR